MSDFYSKESRDRAVALLPDLDAQVHALVKKFSEEIGVPMMFSLVLLQVEHPKNTGGEILGGVVGSEGTREGARNILEIGVRMLGDEENIHKEIYVENKTH